MAARERALLDACVLYPTLLRACLLAAAGVGAFAPLWSPRILEEWRRAVLRRHPDRAAEAAGEIASVALAWPDAAVAPSEAAVAALSLPDPGDRHVMAAAITGQAGTIVTLNLADFPARTLARHNIRPRHPDGFLLEAFDEAEADLIRALSGPLARAGRDLGQPPRALLKRAGLPRLGKAWAARVGGEGETAAAASGRPS